MNIIKPFVFCGSWQVTNLLNNKRSHVEPALQGLFIFHCSPDRKERRRHKDEVNGDDSRRRHRDDDKKSHKRDEEVSTVISPLIGFCIHQSYELL